MSLEFLQALAQGNAVERFGAAAAPSAPPAPPSAPQRSLPHAPFTPSRAIHDDNGDDSNAVYPLPPVPQPPAALTSAASSSSSSGRQRARPSNLVEQEEDSAAQHAPPRSQRASAHRARILLRQQLSQGPPPAPPVSPPQPSSPPPSSTPPPSPPSPSAVRRERLHRRRKKGRVLPDRERPRYLVNTSLLYAHLPYLLALLRDRLLQANYAAAAELLCVLFRVRRLHSESVFHAAAQLLPRVPGGATLPDMLRLYRRMMYASPVRLVPAGVGEEPRGGRAGGRTRQGKAAASFPPVLVKNATEIALQLGILLVRNGLLQQAYDELSQHLPHPPFASISLFHGWCGAIAHMLAVEAQQVVESMGGGADQGDSWQAAEEEEDDGVMAFSLAVMPPSQFSQQSFAPSSALLSQQHKVQLFATAAVRHLQQALTLQPDCDCWLYHLVQVLTTLPSSSSSPSSRSLLALRHLHAFTTLTPSHPIGWSLKLRFLLSSCPSFSCSILTAAVRLLCIDPLHMTALPVLLYYHYWQAAISNATVVRALCNRLDIAGAGRREDAMWRWLHAALHGLDEEAARGRRLREGPRARSWRFVSEDEERQWAAGRTPECEVEQSLAEAKEAEEAERSNAAAYSEERPGSSSVTSAAHRSKRRRGAAAGSSDEQSGRGKRRRTAQAAVSPSSTPVSGSASAASSSPLSVAASSPPAALSHVPVPLLPDACRPLDEELRSRLSWWLSCADLFADVNARSAESDECVLRLDMSDARDGDEQEAHLIRSCTLGLMLRLAKTD